MSAFIKRATFGARVATIHTAAPFWLGAWMVSLGISLIVLSPAAASLSAQGATASQSAVSRLPEKLSDADFWKLVGEISEPGGYFRIEDNFTSNEDEVGRLVTALGARKTGGVYMGVGPEQNFSYITATRPDMAFIVDIRRQAVIQHLMFKAIFELSRDRADFLSLLFSKPRPAGLDTSTSIQKIWDAFWPVATDTSLGPRNFEKISSFLAKTKGFTFTAEENDMLKWVFDNFYRIGPQISTRGAPGGGQSGNNRTFADLTGYSLDLTGNPRSFMSSEANYQFVKAMHEKNLIVPVSGDFGGPKTIRAIGSYVKERGAIVNTFYVSNVEQYLFGDGKQRAFYANVATLPTNDASIFIRPYALRNSRSSAFALCPIVPFLAAFNANRVYDNNAAVACAR